MPEPAVPFFNELLAMKNPNLSLQLACAFLDLDDSSWFERAFAMTERKPALPLAVNLAPGLRRLHDRGHGATAEALRERLIPMLIEQRAAKSGYAIEPLDLLDVFSAPDIPTCTPFGTELP